MDLLHRAGLAHARVAVDAHHLQALARPREDLAELPKDLLAPHHALAHGPAVARHGQRALARRELVELPELRLGAGAREQRGVAATGQRAHLGEGRVALGARLREAVGVEEQPRGVQRHAQACARGERHELRDALRRPRGLGGVAPVGVLDPEEQGDVAGLPREHRGAAAGGEGGHRVERAPDGPGRADHAHREQGHVAALIVRDHLRRRGL